MQQTSFRSDQVFFPFLVVEELYPPTSERRRKVFKLRYTLAGPDIEVEKIKVDLLFWHWTLKLNPKYDIYLETRCQFRQHFTCALRSFSLVTFWIWEKYKSTFVQKMRV